MAMRGVPYVSLTSLRENFLAQNTPYSLYVPITPLVMPSGQHYNTTVLFFMAADVLMRRFAAYIAEQP
jgi:RpiR family glv operon transcriptional regulator